MAACLRLQAGRQLQRRHATRLSSRPSCGSPCNSTTQLPCSSMEPYLSCSSRPLRPSPATWVPRTPSTPLRASAAWRAASHVACSTSTDGAGTSAAASASGAASSSVTATKPTPDTLTGADRAAWDTSVQQLVGGVDGLSEEDASKVLLKAFGWGTQAFWRGTKVNEVPAEGQVAGVLAYLKGSVGFSGGDLSKVLKKFPEVLACSVGEQLEVAVGKLQTEWRLQGDVLTRALVRRPEVLGYSLDCEGTCIGECNRCWARF